MDFSKLRHLGFLVEDVGKTAQLYTSTFGIGPFRTYDVAFSDVRLRGGQPQSFTTKIALARVGESELELVQSRLMTGRCAYFEEVKRNKAGCMHHGAFTVSNLEDEVARFKQAGIGVSMTGKFPGGRFAYLDCEDQAGIVYELMEMTPRQPK